MSLEKIGRLTKMNTELAGEGRDVEGQNSQEKILVVDDEASIRRILETRLKMAGYNVATAADGQEALDQFNAFQPDLVILDVMLPKLDGYEVCRESARRPIHQLSCLQLLQMFPIESRGLKSVLTITWSNLLARANLKLVLKLCSPDC